MSLSRVTGAQSTGSTVTCPTVQDGDVLVLYDCGTSTGSAPTKVIPTDFTEAYSWTSGTAPRPTGAISYAIVGPGQAASFSGRTVTGINGSTANAKMLEVFRESTSKIGGVTVYAPSPATTTSTGDPSDIVAPGSGKAVPGIIIGSYFAGSGAISPRTMSPAKTSEDSADTGNYIAWKLYNSSPADVTIGMDDEGSLNIVGGCYLELKLLTTGDLSKTEAADTVSATGKLTTNATLSKTEAADTLAATAQRTTHGTLSKTEAADTVAGTAQRTTHAAAGITEAADTSTATGQRTTHATAAITEAADTAFGQAILLPLPTASPTAEDGGYGEHLGKQIDERRAAARERDRELDRAIDWAFDPTYPVDEEAIAAAEEHAARQSMAIERLIETMARRRDDDDAIAVLLMVM